MKKMILIMVLLTILFGLITAILIVNKKSEIVTTNPVVITTYNNDKVSNKAKTQLYREYHLPIDDNTPGSSSSQTYDTNPIQFTKYTYDSDKVHGEYFQIEGLKNKEIETKINEKLESAVIEFGEYAYDEVVKYDEAKKKSKDVNYDDYKHFSKYVDGKKYFTYSYLESEVSPEDWQVCIDEAVLFNGANVISIMVSEKDEFYYWNQECRFVNINLITGEEIKIEELFTKDYSVYNAFVSSIYSKFPKGDITWKKEKYTYEDENGVEQESYYETDGMYESVDVEKQEQMARKFKYTKDINFGFTDAYVLICFDDVKVNIRLYDEPEKLALFSRFSTPNNIYDGEYSNLKNIPAFLEVSKGGAVKAAQSFVEDDDVILNYYIKYSGTYEDEENYSEAIKFATKTIKSMVDYDTARLNAAYDGENKLLYSACFEVFINDLQISDYFYEDYLKIGTKYLYFNYEPDVYEISSESINLIKSDWKHNMYSYYRFNNDLYYFDAVKQEYVYGSNYKGKKYRPYYEEIRGSMFKSYGEITDEDPDPYYSPTYKEYFLISDDYRALSLDELEDYVVIDKEGLANQVWNLHPEIWNYKDIDKNNYSIEFNASNVSVYFPYYHTGVESWENYNTNYYTYINVNSVTLFSSDKSPYIYVEEYGGF